MFGIFWANFLRVRNIYFKESPETSINNSRLWVFSIPPQIPTLILQYVEEKRILIRTAAKATVVGDVHKDPCVKQLAASHTVVRRMWVSLDYHLPRARFCTSSLGMIFVCGYFLG